MIVIPLRPVVTNLIVTVFNGIAELLCLSAMLVVLALYECRRWTNGASVSIKWHCRQVRVITLLAIVMFIVTEAILSVNTNLYYHPVNQNYSCVKTEINLREVNESYISANALAVTYACMREKNTTFSFRTGAFIDTGEGSFTCNGKREKPAYEYVVGRTVNLSTSDAAKHCATASCVFVTEQMQDNATTLYVSEPILLVELTDVTRFYATKIFFNHSEELSGIAKRASNIYLDGITDEMEVRRRLFFGERKGTCEHPEKLLKYSEIPKHLFWGTICLWIFLLLASAVIYFNKKKVFYEIRNVWDWARKTHQLVDSDVRENMEFVWVEVNGERRMYLKDSRSTDQLLKEDGVKFKKHDV